MMDLDFKQFFMNVDIVDETEFVSCRNDRGKCCCVGEKHGGVGELCVGIEEDKTLIKKRKKQCYLPMLDWLKTAAKNPCDPGIGTMPKSSKWKANGSEHVWKQVLMAKETVSLKVNVDPNAKQSFSQVIVDSC